MSQIFIKNGVSVITGGASGIGLSLAKRCRDNGMRVIIADRDDEALAAAKTNLGGAVTAHKMDVGNGEDWEALAKKLKEEYGGQVNFIALNAGMGAKSPWSDVSAFEKIYRTNIMGVVNGIAALLPLVEATASAESRPSIVITGSKQGITNPPGAPAYNSSKAAVKSLAEHLSWDLRDKNIAVHFLVPGWTYTGMSGNRADAGTTKPDGAWWPDQVVAYLETKMREGQFWVVCPDNDVSEDLDKKRVKWTAGDLVQGRPPLSRWREDWKEKAAKSIEEGDA